MRLRLATAGLLVPAAILFAAAAHAEGLSLPLQLSQFLTGAHPAKAQPAEAGAKPRAHPTRHAARRAVAPHHVAARHAAPMEAHAGHPAEEAPRRLTSSPPSDTAAPAERPAPGPAEAAAPPAVAAQEPAVAAPEYVDGVRVVSAGEFNEIDAAADEVKVVPADEVNAIDLAAGPPVRTDGRNPDSTEPVVQGDADPVTWPRLLAFGLGGPLLIGLFAWPILARRRTRHDVHFR